jgi:hypothetical protein
MNRRASNNDTDKHQLSMKTFIQKHCFIVDLICVVLDKGQVSNRKTMCLSIHSSF